jgi:hypothetical protein
VEIRSRRTRFEIAVSRNQALSPIFLRIPSLSPTISLDSKINNLFIRSAYYLRLPILTNSQIRYILI